MSRTSSLVRTSARLSVTAVAFGVLLSPSAAFAATSTRESAFCTNLPTTITTVNNSIATLTGKLGTAFTNRTDTFTANRAQWDSELATKRAQWDQQRQTSFTKLEAKATTSAQKTAVQTYETTITNAVTTRRSANDAARDTFRTAALGVINGRQSTIEGQLATFKDAVTAAETTAQASCTSDPSQGVSNRTTFRDALKTAREAYTADRKSDSQVGDQIKTLAQTRDTTIKANDATFTATASAARQALKTAFGNQNV
jgi:hypothetical protein